MNKHERCERHDVDWHASMGTELEKQCAQQEHTQLAAWLPKLQATIDGVEEAIKECAVVKQVADEW